MKPKKVLAQIDPNVAEDVAANLQELKPGETLTVSITRRIDRIELSDIKIISTDPSQELKGGVRSDFILRRRVEGE